VTRPIRGSVTFDPKRLQSCSKAGEEFLRGPIPSARLFTRGEQFRAPIARFAPRHLLSKVPRLSSSWLARHDPFGLNGFERRAGRVRPTDATHVVKDEHPCTWQPAALFSGESRCRHRARRFSDAEPTSASSSSRRTECSRLDTASLELVSGASSPAGRVVRLNARTSNPGRPRPLRPPPH